jgi:hypothetical protein
VKTALRNRPFTLATSQTQADNFATHNKNRR